MTRLSLAIALVLAGFVPSSTVGAQRARQAAARPQPIAKPTVLVLPVARDQHDSIRTILERDLDYGDLLEVIRVDSDLLRPLVEGDNPPILSPDSVGQFSARFVVRAERRLDTLRVTVFDTTLKAAGVTRSFAAPSAPPDRARFVHDSLVQAYAQREGAARARLAQLGAMYDSLLQAGRGRQPRNARQRALQIAQRDSLFAAIAVEAPSLHASISRMPTERDSLIRVRVPHEALVYDSLSYVERMGLHAVADELQQWLTGLRGAAASRIAFVKDGFIYVIDSDGANERVLTRSGRALSPAWHPSGRWIVYADINETGTQIAEVEVGTGRVRLLNATPRGYNITPVYTPDGKRIVYAASGTSGTQLVAVDRESMRLTRLGSATSNASSPTFSPDGRRMAFVVPRVWQRTGSGVRSTPQLFIASAAGTASEQLTSSAFGVRSYRTSPEWSPNGEHVAFTEQSGGFQVWVLSVRDRRARGLTRGTDHEDPSWAPDSRHLVHSVGRDIIYLAVIDMETGRSRRLTESTGGRLPSWGPRWDPRQPIVRRENIYAALP